jgi:RNA polymerase sigma-70 factor, ECF subfamily
MRCLDPIVFADRIGERSTSSSYIARLCPRSVRRVSQDIVIEPASDPDIRLVNYVGEGSAHAERQRRDHALAERVRAGDADAFTAVYDAYRVRLFRLAYEYTRDKRDAEDVVADVFLRLWEIRASWSITSTIAAYLCTSVRNRATDLWRRARNQKKIAAGRVIHAGSGWSAGVSAHPAPHDASPDDVVFNSGERRLFETDLKTAIDTAVAAMPRRVREVFQISKCMSDDEALSYAEIAEVLKIVPSTVRQHLIKALDILEAQLDASGWSNVLRRQDRGRLTTGSEEP